MSANDYSSVNTRTLLLSCLGHWMSYMTSFVIDVRTLPLYWIAFNSSVERWMILTLINNECGSVIDFNGLLLVDLLVMLLPISHVNRYSCHLWGTHLMYVVVVHHMDDASLMDDAVFLFFCYMMDKGIFLLFSCPPIPAVVFTDTIGIWKVTSLWLLYPMHILWWMFSVSSWLVLVCDYLDVLEPFLGFPLAFFYFFIFLYSSCIDDDSLYCVSTILF